MGRFTCIFLDFIMCMVLKTVYLFRIVLCIWCYKLLIPLCFFFKINA